MSSITERMRSSDKERVDHHGGSLEYETLQVLEDLIGHEVERTAETGCGRSTILLSNLAREHFVFCLDDHACDGSSVDYFQNSRLARKDNVSFTFGPTQETLAQFGHRGFYDAVLLDGPHGFPFPELEYYHFYPKIRIGGLLIVDDVQIATIGLMADVLQEDAMWNLEALSLKTAVFRRTDAELCPPTGDHWYTQNYNRRRTNVLQVALNDDGRLPCFEDRLAARATIVGKTRRFFEKLTHRTP